MGCIFLSGYTFDASPNGHIFPDLASLGIRLKNLMKIQMIQNHLHCGTDTTKKQ